MMALNSCNFGIHPFENAIIIYSWLVFTTPKCKVTCHCLSIPLNSTFTMFPSLLATTSMTLGDMIVVDPWGIVILIGQLEMKGWYNADCFTNQCFCCIMFKNAFRAKLNCFHRFNDVVWWRINTMTQEYNYYNY